MKMNKRTKFTKLTAMLLSIIFVLGSFVTAVSASDVQSSVTDKTLDDVKRLLNASTYDEYSQKYSDEGKYPRGEREIVISGLDYDKTATDAAVKSETYDGITALYTPDKGSVTFTVNVPKTAKYGISIDYYPVEGKSTSIQRTFLINGKVPFAEAYYITFTKVWSTVYQEAIVGGATFDQLSRGEIRPFKQDVDGNELRNEVIQTPEWRTYSLRDVDGFYTEPFEFLFNEGENTITLEAVNEPMAIKSITLYPVEELPSYAEYLKQYEGEHRGTDTIKLEAEVPYQTSTATIYPIEDRASAVTSPADTSRTLLNTIGGDKWQTSGQWVRYKFTVNDSGMYSIITRFMQNINDGMYSSRILSVYSGEGVAEGEKGYYNGVPFREANELRFNYSTDWQTEALRFGTYGTDSKGNQVMQYTDVELYFKSGVEYVIELEASLGTMGDIVRRVNESLDVINEAYLSIMKLTGATPDADRDYNFLEIMPETVAHIILESRSLYAVAEELTSLAGIKSSNVATLERTAWLLERMGSDPEDEIARNLSELKSRIGSLGTWLNDAKTQPLKLDVVCIQSTEAARPKAKANFFQSFAHEFSSFIQSFLRNYNRMGADTIETDDAVEVWLAKGRDQSQVIRNLINNDFTPRTGIQVNLKLVAGGTLLPSILAGMGPNVYIGLGDDSVINYAIRGALEDVSMMEGFDEVTNTTPGDPNQQFTEAAMFVLELADADGVTHCYGLPEEQNFPMMFLRTDILAELNIEIPKTWEDVLAAVIKLQQNNMTIAMSNDYKIFLYQMGGTLFADEGMRINLDSNLALDSFEQMCNLFKMYSFPYKYDFANRFRTGEMPIGIASYNSTYNQLVVFATELRGKWQFLPLPGFEQDDGTINNVSVSSVNAIVMITGADEQTKKDAWEFMKWHTGAQCQIDYSNEMVAIMGDSAKYATANVQALDSLPWTREEYENLNAQFTNLASIPNYPGAYIIGRYTKFAFLSVYNDNADAVTEMLRYITTINKEITRKRAEFGLPTLEIGQTLASLRHDQIVEALDELEDAGSAAAYSAQISALRKAMEDVPTYSTYCEDEYIDALRAAGAALGDANAELFGSIAKMTEECAKALKSYQSSYPATTGTSIY